MVFSARTVPKGRRSYSAPPGLTATALRLDSTGAGPDREGLFCQQLMAEKGGSRTLRRPYDLQTGFEDQRRHRTPSFSICAGAVDFSSDRARL